MTPTQLPYGSADALDQSSLDEVSRNIREHGVQLVAVYDSAHQDYRPFIYTIGFRSCGGPELIAFGEDEEELAEVGELFQRIARKNGPVVPGKRLRHGGRSLVAAAPDPDLDRFLQMHCLNEARAYYGVARVEVLVIVEEDELTDTASRH